MHALLQACQGYLQDEEAKQGCEVQLAKQGRQDAPVDLQVWLRDLQACSRLGDYIAILTAQRQGCWLANRRQHRECTIGCYCCTAVGAYQAQEGPWLCVPVNAWEPTQQHAHEQAKQVHLWQHAVDSSDCVALHEVMY